MSEINDFIATVNNFTFAAAIKALNSTHTRCLHLWRSLLQKINEFNPMQTTAVFAK
ncbi:hypothetical protein [Nostoc sp.]|uniref:hypothetical protein n=1 Tax=Nostoc sp. TaxID=1180 RepID=UPI002FF44899